MNKQLADFILLSIAFIWGATFVIVQKGITQLDPLLFNTVRFFVAGLSLLCLIPFMNRSIQWTRKTILHGAVLGVFLSLGYGLQTIGLLYTSPSRAGFITGLSVVMVPLFSFILIKKAPQPLAIFGSLLAAVGLYFLSFGDAKPFNIGDVYVLFCAFGFTLHIIYTDCFARQSPAFELAVSQLFTVSLLSLVGALLLEDVSQILDRSIMFHRDVLIALFITSLFATSFPFFAQTYVQKYTTPARVALIYTMEPVFAAIVAYFWIDERLSMIATIGCFFIFIGMVSSELPSSIVRNMLKGTK
jgi:drug/metabolite transporter (DMT)-like permease